jgi:hypothetical protein
MAIRTPQSLNDFDFWVGSWHGTWDGGAAVKVVEKLYGGRVVVERFAAEQPDPFVGGAVGEEMHFTRDAQVGGKDILQRMRWAAIKADAFQWFWQRREDGGEWETVWHISYVRAEPDSVCEPGS